MSGNFIDIGHIVKQTKFGEADKFVKIFSQNHGLIETIAKGARRQTSKKSAHLDSLNLIKFQVDDRQSGHYLLQAEVINSYPQIKADLKLTRTCFYILEIINQVVVFNQPDPSLFHSLLNYLNALNTGQHSRDLNTKFQLYLIKHLGFEVPKNHSPESLIHYFETLTNRSFTSTKIKF